MSAAARKHHAQRVASALAKLHDAKLEQTNAKYLVMVEDVQALVIALGGNADAVTGMSHGSMALYLVTLLIAKG